MDWEALFQGLKGYQITAGIAVVLVFLLLWKALDVLKTYLQNRN